jgi:hypothetical protein
MNHVTGRGEKRESRKGKKEKRCVRPGDKALGSFELESVPKHWCQEAWSGWEGSSFNFVESGGCRTSGAPAHPPPKATPSPTSPFAPATGPYLMQK